MKSYPLEFLDVLRDPTAVDVGKKRFVPTEEKCIIYIVYDGLSKT